MSPARPARPKLRAREVVLAVAAGALAAGGAALILDSDTPQGPQARERGGDVKTTYPVSAFEEISTVGPQDVVVTLGDRHSVRAEGSSRSLGQLEAVVRDGRLTIQPKGNYGMGFNWRSVADATFYVTVPRLEAVALAGSGEVRVDRVDGPTFSATVAGSGELTVDEIRADRADLSVAGSGELAVAGTAADARVSIGGSGDIDAEELRSQTASVTVGGSGDASLTVEREARISVMGSGDVDIAGPAQCSVSRMGSGEVSCESDD